MSQGLLAFKLNLVIHLGRPHLPTRSQALDQWILKPLKRERRKLSRWRRRNRKGGSRVSQRRERSCLRPLVECESPPLGCSQGRHCLICEDLSCHYMLLMPATRLPIRWAGEKMVVNENVLIAPPFRPENCQASKGNDASLTRVKKLVESTWAKSAERSTRSTTPQPRKGG